MKFVKNITNSNFIPKINKSTENKGFQFSDVDAIENLKIILEKISTDKINFINCFEIYNGFYKDSNKKKEDKKQNIYPEQYIRSFYDEIKER